MKCYNYKLHVYTLMTRLFDSKVRLCWFKQIRELGCMTCSEVVLQTVMPARTNKFYVTTHYTTWIKWQERHLINYARMGWAWPRNDT